MIGHSALRKIVGADSLAAIPRSNLRTPIFGNAVFLFALLGFKKLSLKELHCLISVLKLASFLLAFNDKPAWDMRQPNRRFGLIDVLTARAAALTGLKAYIRRQNINFYIFGFRKYGNRYGRCLNSPLRLGNRNSLNAVNTAFVF